MKAVAPFENAGSFTCPHCAAIAQQTWQVVKTMNWRVMDEAFSGVSVGTCSHCQQRTIWFLGKMIHPDHGSAPLPNLEMPHEVKKLYLEAAAIFNRSPRSAAALLRLAIQVLCKHLGEPGKNINEDIASMVKKGLPEQVQQSLDYVRVIGNEAVHPGVINTDDPKIVSTLFDLVNIIVEYMIAMPKKVSGLYANLPVKTRETIIKRDT